MTLHVFVGYDIREHAAYQVCRETLLRPIGHSPLDIEVHPLSHRDLRRRGLFDRPWRIDETGQFWDERDGRPFSTEFAHSRFLVPKIAAEMGIKAPVVFVDCDFMFLRPITEMLAGCDRTKMLSVVKHDFSRVAEGVKMDGMAQQRYFRKLWSSLMVFNMAHPHIDYFTHADYDPCHEKGSDLHGFAAVSDNEIGALPASWNWIPGHSDPVSAVDAVHWSLGGPWMPGFEATPFASEWRHCYRGVVQQAFDGSGKLSDLFPLV